MTQLHKGFWNSRTSGTWKPHRSARSENTQTPSNSSVTIATKCRNSPTRNRNAVPDRFNVKKPFCYSVWDHHLWVKSSSAVDSTYSVNKQTGAAEVTFCYGGPEDMRVNLHTPPLLKAALSCQEQSHLHTVMVCFSVNSGNGICGDVGYKLSRKTTRVSGILELSGSENSEDTHTWELKVDLTLENKNELSEMLLDNIGSFSVKAHLENALCWWLGNIRQFSTTLSFRTVTYWNNTTGQTFGIITFLTNISYS